MRKISYLTIVFMIVIFSAPVNSNAKPIWLKFKLGLFAKWSVTINGECEDGWGICLALGDNLTQGQNQNFFGYDDTTDKISVKISKQWSSAKSFSSGTFEIGADSQTDPKLIENIPNFKNKGKSVFIKKGIYKVIDEGDYYLFIPDYYVQ
jgi:hypothetical protein